MTVGREIELSFVLFHVHDQNNTLLLILANMHKMNIKYISPNQKYIGTENKYISFIYLLSIYLNTIYLLHPLLSHANQD